MLMAKNAETYARFTMNYSFINENAYVYFVRVENVNITRKIILLKFSEMMRCFSNAQLPLFPLNVQVNALCFTCPHSGLL